jgi:hypothetical protein
VGNIQPSMSEQQTEYVRQILQWYCRCPETVHQVRPLDRKLAVQLYHRQVPLAVVEAAILLATARRTFRWPDAPTLSPVRSLFYFVPVIEEILRQPLDAEYVRYLRYKLERHYSN